MTQTNDNNPSRGVTAVAPWYGSQHGVNHLIVPQLGPHTWFYDLCCGGCSLLLAKPPSRVEVVNDKHPGLINFLRVLSSFRWRLLNELLQNAVLSHAVFEEAEAFVTERGWLVAPNVAHVDHDHVMAAYYQYILWWMGQGGMAGSKAGDERPRMSTRYTEGGRVGTRFRTATRNVPALRKRIERVEFWNQDLFKVLGKIEDRPDTVIYADPPWLDDGDAYSFSFEQTYERPATLMDDGEREEDAFDRFAEAVGRFKKARVIVRLGDHPRVTELFMTWAKVRTDRTNHLGSQGRRDGTSGQKKPEVLLINQDKIETPDTGGTDADEPV